MSATASTRVSSGVALPPAGRYEVDAAHSGAGFVARHLMLSKVRGRFTDLDATVVVGEDVESSSVEATIRAASIDTGNEGRDGHLRSPDFLDADRFPALTFRSTSVEQTGAGALAVTGDLTIRDVTRPVVLDVAYLGLAPDPAGAVRIAFEASATIDREEFGITWNQALEAGGVVVGKTVRIELEIQAVAA